jgi:16S rRNA (cytosine967-C5)-methyltransferase
MNVARVRHLENAIVHFERTLAGASPGKMSLDSHLRVYHAAHKRQLSRDDKEWLSDKFKDIYRWKSLLEHFSSEPKSTVSLLRAYFGTANWRGYANSKTLPDQTRLSLPLSLLEALSKQYGKEKAREVATIYNEKPTVYLRVNPLVSSREEIIKIINTAGIAAEPSINSHVGIKVSRSPKLLDLSILDDHACEFQDESCQVIGTRIASLISGSSPRIRPVKILDFCSGSGGKSLVFGPTLQGKGHIFLHDINPRYLQQARMKMKAAKIPNFTIIASEENRLRGKMDYVLVDAPSTGSGQFRRYPERKWMFTDDSLTSSVQRQRDIFKQALKYLRGDGKIIYSVSSILSPETWEQVKYFCETHKLFLSYEPVHSLPVSHGMDGFFCAIMERQK